MIRPLRGRGEGPGHQEKRSPKLRFPLKCGQTAEMETFVFIKMKGWGFVECRMVIIVVKSSFFLGSKEHCVCKNQYLN